MTSPAASPRPNKQITLKIIIHFRCESTLEHKFYGIKRVTHRPRFTIQNFSSYFLCEDITLLTEHTSRLDDPSVLTRKAVKMRIVVLRYCLFFILFNYRVLGYGIPSTFDKIDILPASLTLQPAGKTAESAINRCTTCL